jgi:cell division topological specificity factor
LPTESWKGGLKEQVQQSVNFLSLLTVMLATERGSNALPHMEDIKREILEVIKKYTKVKEISIKTDNNQNIDLLEVEIILDK